MQKKSKIQFQNGFTIIEALLALAILAIIAVIGMPVYQSFLVRNDLDLGAATLAQSLRRAQLLSQTGNNDNMWGVNIATGSITIFQGPSFASRDIAFDEGYEISQSISSTGIQEVIFSKLFGEPQNTGSFTLTSSNGEVRTLIINQKGMIEY